MKAEVCHRFAQAITLSGLTQAEFSRLLGRDPTVVNRVVKGKQWPSYPMLALLVERGISADWVVTGHGATARQDGEVHDLTLLIRDVLRLGGPRAAGRIEGYLDALWSEYAQSRPRQSARPADGTAEVSSLESERESALKRMRNRSA